MKPLLLVAMGLAIAAGPPELEVVIPDPPPKAKAEEPKADLSGFWYCRGQLAGGKRYSGIVVVRQQDGDAYAVEWVFPGGTYLGAGLREGDRLIIGYAAMEREKDGRGVLTRGVYSMRVSGTKASGTYYALPGAGVVQREDWEFLRGLDE